AQPLDVRPAENVAARPDHLLRVERRRELDVLRLRRRLAALDEIRERKADPRNHHRPGFDAAMAVDAFLERLALENVFDVIRRLLVALAVDDDVPVGGDPVPRILGRQVLVDAELVVVVVRGDLIPRVRLVDRGVGAERALLDVRQLLPVLGGDRRGQLRRAEGAGRHGGGAGRGRLDELPAVEVVPLAGDLRALDVRGPLDQHVLYYKDAASRSGVTPRKYRTIRRRCVTVRDIHPSLSHLRAEVTAGLGARYSRPRRRKRSTRSTSSMIGRSA